MFLIQFDVWFLRMIIIHAILLIIFLFGSGFAQSDTAESSNSLQAEATVEIQYDGEVGSGIIPITSYPASCTTSVTSNSITNTPITSTTSLSITPIWTSSCTSFNTPPIFGATRTQMINTTSTSQYLFQTATGASQVMTGIMATQNLSGSSTSTPQASPVTGSGTRFHNIWSHVFFWAAVAEIMSGYL